jgi:hypothetical protein
MKTYKTFLLEVKNIRRKKENLKVDIEAERGEFERYPDSKNLMKRARTSPVKKLSDQEVSKLTNTDAADIRPGAQGRRNVRRLAKQYGRDVNRVIQQVKSKSDEPSIATKDGELIAGNTRAMVRRSLGRPVKALVVKD